MHRILQGGMNPEIMIERYEVSISNFIGIFPHPGLPLPPPLQHIDNGAVPFFENKCPCLFIHLLFLFPCIFFSAGFL